MGNISNNAKPVMLDVFGYGGGNDKFANTDETKVAAAVYKIPPVVWVVVFLLVGYFGVRKLMED